MIWVNINGGKGLLVTLTLMINLVNMKGFAFVALGVMFHTKKNSINQQLCMKHGLVTNITKLILLLLNLHIINPSILHKY